MVCYRIENLLPLSVRYCVQYVKFKIIKIFYILVGKPIDVQQVAEPTKEQITELHSQFVDSITNLFDKYKSKCLKNVAEMKLIID